MMIKKLIKNKFREIVPEPDFMEDKVVFYKVVNPDPSIREGEKWEVSPIGFAPTGKYDRRGKPIFVCKVKTLKRIEWLNFTEATVSPEGIWEVPVYSGDVFIEKRSFPEEGREVYVPSYVELYYFSTYNLSLFSVLQGHKEEIDKISFLAIAQGERRDWLTPEHINFVIAKYEQYKARIEQSQREEEAKEGEITSLIAEGSKIELSKEAILRLFILNNCTIVRKDAHFYDSVFDVGGLRFRPAPTTEDYNSPVVTSAGEATGEIKYVLNRIAKWAREEDVEYLLSALGIKKPEQKLVWQKKVRLSFSSYRGTYETYTTEADAKAQLEPKLAQALEQVQVEPIVYELPELSITFIPTFTSLIEKEIDIEEGVGAKDATWYEDTYLVAKIVVNWDCTVSFGEVHPEVRKHVEEALT